MPKLDIINEVLQGYLTLTENEKSFLTGYMTRVLQENTDKKAKDAS